MTTRTGRNTKTKELITHIFETTQGPLSLQEIWRYVKISLPATAYSTVFRVVLRLEAAGAVKRVDWRERGSRYEWARHPHHHHIVCQICRQVSDLDDADLNYDEQYIQQKTGYLTKHHSIELEGICPACQAKLNSE
jgi:Fe2+ or Zn2+ uptake regulation protein